SQPATRALHSFPTRRSSDLFSTAGQLISRPTICRADPRRCSSASRPRPTNGAPSSCTRRPSPISYGEYFCDSISAFLLLWKSTRSEEHTSELQSLAYLVCRL